MPQTRRVEGLARRYAVRQAVPTLLMFALIGFAAARGQIRDALFWGCVAGSVTLLAVVLATHWRMLRRFACPSCGRRLPRCDDRQGGSEISYYCAHDDTVWQTGLHVPDGS